MNKKTRALIGGAGVSAAVAAVALSGGTSAFFYDAQSIDGNSLQACDFALVVESTVAQTKAATGSSAVDQDQSENNSTGSSINISGMQPGEEWTANFALTNTGNCDADLWGDVDDHAGLDQPLAKRLLVTSSYNGSPLTTDMPFDQFATLFPYELAESHSGTGNLVVKVAFPESGQRGVENDAMGNELDFNIDFALIQEGVDPTTGANGGPSLGN